jgi:hypothetical protein
MIVICTSFPAAAAAPSVYVPLKSLAGAANALNTSASNITAETRRDVRAEIMGIPPLASAVAEARQNESLFETAFRDESPEGTLLLSRYIVLRYS